MATINWPGPKRGSSRPYGYQEELTQTGAGSIYIGVPSDVHQIGATVLCSSGSYFLEGSMSPTATIEADSGVWADLIGDGSVAQTTSRQITVDGAFSCVRVRCVSGAQTLTVEMRRS